METTTDKYANFIEKLPNIQNEKDLCALICDIGLFNDHRQIYGKYESFKIERGGIWQDPLEFATFLWNSKDDFKGASSFLEIGTFTGYSFFIILQFLRAFVNKDIVGKTVDPSDIYKHTAIEPYISPYYQNGTSEDIKDEHYDIVFIDGCHSNPWPLLDFNNTSHSAKCVFFHDINDKYCPDVITTFSLLEKKYKSKRYTCASNPDQFGLGIIFPKYQIISHDT